MAMDLKGNVAQVIAKLVPEFDKLSSLVDSSVGGIGKLSKMLSELGGSAKALEKLPAALKALDTVTLNPKLLSEFDKLAAAAEKITLSAKDMASAMGGNAREAEATAKYLDAAVRSLEAGSKIKLQPGPPPVPGAPRPRGGGERGGFTGGDAMITGLGLGMVGAPLISLYDSAIKNGFSVGHMQAVLRADDRVTEGMATAAADRAAKVTDTVKGSTTSANLGLLIDLKQVTGSLSEAMEVLPEFAKLVTTLEAMDRRGGGAGDPGFAAAKAMEILGRLTTKSADGTYHIDPAELARNVGLVTSVAVGTNMRVDPAAYLAFAKQARVGGMALGDKALFEDFPALMMVLGGSRAGTGEAATYQQFINGQMTKNTFEMLKAHHLLNRGARWKGGRVQDMPHQLVGAQTFMDDPVEWVRQILNPQLEKEGIRDPVQKAQAVSTFSGRNTTAGFLGEMVRALLAIDKEAENMRHTRGDSFAQFQDRDPSQQIRNVQAAWQNLLTAFGSAGAEQAAAGLHSIADGLQSVGKWARENPDEARLAVQVAGGLGLIATSLGALSTAIFLFAPALKLLGIAGGTAAEGAAVGGTLGAGLAGGAVLGTGILVTGAAMGAIGYGDTHTASKGYAIEHGQDPAFQYKAARAEADKAAADALHAGPPMKVTLPPGPLPVTQAGTFDVRIINGGDLVNGISSHIMRGFGGPPTGAARFDERTVPTHPGHAP